MIELGFLILASDYVDIAAELLNIAFLLAKVIDKMHMPLRCILFHGGLVPSAESQKIYEHAYFILKMIIDRL